MPDVVVDVGNTRVKWGRVTAGRVAEVAALPPDPAAWDDQARVWGLGRTSWATAGVHPQRLMRFRDWAAARGDAVREIRFGPTFPMTVDVPHPERVGIDRLLGALAGRSLAGWPCVVVDAGTAITVNRIDAAGSFAGGAILPGLRLMAKSLREHTAQLPEVDATIRPPVGPGRDTDSALRLGIFAAAVGGVRHLIDSFASERREPVIVTGGDGSLIADALGARYEPALTLEGVRLAAEALP